MAQLSKEEFEGKWVPRFDNNVFQNIDGDDLQEFTRDLCASFAGIGAVNADAVPPAVSFDTATRRLTAQHPLGTAELEYSHNNGAYLPYEPVQLDEAQHPQGEWRFRVRATGGRNASAPTDSPLIAAKTAPLALQVAFALSRTALTAGQGLNFTGTASGGKPPYAHLVTATSQDTGAVAQLGTAATAGYTNTWASVPAGTYDLVDTVTDAAGSRVISSVRTAVATAAVVVGTKPAAPTSGLVDDEANTFSGVAVAGFASLAEYEGFGFPGTSGNLPLTADNAYQAGTRIYLKGITGAALKGAVGFRVAASGSRPAGDFLTNQDAFTGSPVVTPPASTQAAKPRFGAIDDVNNTVPLASDYAYTEVRWGVEGQGAQTLGSNSICSPGNVAGRLYAYVVADAGANRLQSDTVYSDAFSSAASANNKPTATISVVGGTSSVTPGQSVTLQLDGADADAGDSVTKIEALDNGVKIGEISGNSGGLQTAGLTAGGHSFTARAYDTKGASGLSTAVLVTAQEPPTGQLTEYALNPSARQACGQALPYLGGFLLNTAAYYEFDTTATLLDMQGATGLGVLSAADAADFGVFVGTPSTIGSPASFKQRANLGLSAGAGTDPVWVPMANISATGTKRIRIVVPAQVRNGAGTQNVIGTVLLKLRANAAITWVTSFPAYDTDYFVGEDSIAFSNPVNPYTDAWVCRLRERVKGNARVIVLSMAGASALDLYGSNSDKNAYQAQYASTAATAINLYILGANDAGRLNASAADFGAAYTNLLQDAHGAYPSRKLLPVTPFTTGQLEGRLTPLRTKLKEIGAPLSYVAVIDGPPAFSGIPGPSKAGDPDDGAQIHPGTVQHASIENYLWGKINNVDPNLFSDVFPGNVLNARWTNGIAGGDGTTVAVVNNSLRITATVGPGHQGGATSALPYSLLAYAFQCQVGSLFTPRPEAVQYIGFYPDAGTSANGYQLVIKNGRTLFAGPQFGVLADVAYDATAHKYLRFLGMSGNVVAQTSPDGSTWVNPFGITHQAPFSLANVRLLVGGGGGPSTDTTNWPTGTPLGTATFLQAGITPNGTGGGTTTPPVAGGVTHVEDDDASISYPSGASVGSGLGTNGSFRTSFGPVICSKAWTGNSVRVGYLTDQEYTFTSPIEVVVDGVAVGEFSVHEPQNYNGVYANFSVPSGNHTGVTLRAKNGVYESGKGLYLDYFEFS